MMAYLTVLGTMPAYANSSLLTHCNPDQASGRDLSGERFVWSLFRDVSQRGESHAPVLKPSGTPWFLL